MSREIKGSLILPKKPQLQIIHRQSVLDFGVITLGNSKTLKFSIKNCGEDPLNTEFSIKESWIEIKPSTVSLLKKGEVREIEVKAEPKDIEPGGHKIKLLIKSNDLREENKQVYILSQIEEKNQSIEIVPNFIELNDISSGQIYNIKAEIKNLSDSNEIASVEVEIKPEDQWLTYEIETSYKDHLYINFKINPKKLNPGNYKTTVLIRELFDHYSLPLELPVSFNIPLEDLKSTGKLVKSSSKEVRKFIKNLVIEEHNNEGNDLLYTDKKTYSIKHNTFIFIGLIIIIIFSIILLIIRL